MTNLGKLYSNMFVSQGTTCSYAHLNWDFTRYFVGKSPFYKVIDYTVHSSNSFSTFQSKEVKLSWVENYSNHVKASSLYQQKKLIHDVWWLRINCIINIDRKRRQLNKWNCLINVFVGNCGNFRNKLIKYSEINESFTESIIFLWVFRRNIFFCYLFKIAPM